jgi:hypothetical protein
MSWFKRLFSRKSNKGLYYESSTASILWNDAVGVAILKWKKRVEAEKYRDICKRTLDLLVAKNCTKWYENRSKLGEPSNSDMQWFHTSFRDQLLANDIKKQAILIGSRAFKKKKYESWLYQLADDGTECRYFDEKKEAVRWLVK